MSIFQKHLNLTACQGMIIAILLIAFISSGHATIFLFEDRLDMSASYSFPDYPAGPSETINYSGSVLSSPSSITYNTGTCFDSPNGEACSSAHAYFKWSTDMDGAVSFNASSGTLNVSIPGTASSHVLVDWIFETDSASSINLGGWVFNNPGFLSILLYDVTADMAIVDESGSATTVCCDFSLAASHRYQLSALAEMKPNSSHDPESPFWYVAFSDVVVAAPQTNSLALLGIGIIALVLVKRRKAGMPEAGQGRIPVSG